MKVTKEMWAGLRGEGKGKERLASSLRPSGAVAVGCLIRSASCVQANPAELPLGYGPPAQRHTKDLATLYDRAKKNENGRITCGAIAQFVNTIVY